MVLPFCTNVANSGAFTVRVSVRALAGSVLDVAAGVAALAVSVTIRLGPTLVLGLGP